MELELAKHRFTGMTLTVTDFDENYQALPEVAQEVAMLAYEDARDFILSKTTCESNKTVSEWCPEEEIVAVTPSFYIFSESEMQDFIKLVRSS